MVSVMELVGGVVIKAANVEDNDVILVNKDGKMYLVTKDSRRLGGLFVSDVGAVGETYDEKGNLVEG